MTLRERAYAVVKKLKAAYTKDGCDWQVEIECVIADAVAEERERIIAIVRSPLYFTRETLALIDAIRQSPNADE